MAIVYGNSGSIFGTVDESYGYVSNIQESHSIEEAELQDGQGDIVAAAYHGQKGELTMDWSVKASGAPGKDDLGTVITIAQGGEFDGTYILTGVTRTRTRADWASGSLTCRSHDPALSLVTTTTTGS